MLTMITQSIRRGSLLLACIHFIFFLLMGQASHALAASTQAKAAKAAKATDTARICKAAPLGSVELYLRGSMSTWAATDNYQWQYDCDAYYLNVNLQGKHEFKIGEESWRDESSFGTANAGAPPSSEGKSTQAITELALASASAPGGIRNTFFEFSGTHTLRLSLDANGKGSLQIGPKNRADPVVRTITHPIALSLRHDTRLLSDKAPFGAQPNGSQISFAVHALAGLKNLTLVIEKRTLEGDQEVLAYKEVARVPMRLNGIAGNKKTEQEWRANFQFNDVSVYGYYFETRIAGVNYVLQNNQQALYWTRERGANGLGVVTEMPSNTKRIRRFRQTIYSADFVVPAWAKDVVYYYIFPERFRNGDRSNDPKVGVNTYQNHPIEVHKTWLEKPYRAGSNDGSDKVYSNDFFGGDIAGIIEKLDYIASLGANTIYMTPVFSAPSNHKYDTADYKNIDTAFGNNEDFTRLTTEAAKRGIRVIPDTSLNHTGSDSLYFDRFGKYNSRGAFRGAQVQNDSPYASWFKFDTKQKEADKQYRGWVGTPDLPELDKSSPAFRRFAYGDADSVTRLWLQRGAAGWRMDVAPWVPDDFWREWRKVVKQEKPDALIVAETWFDSSKYFLGDTFDSSMNYIFRSTVLDYAAGGKANALYHNIEYMRETYPAQSFYAMMNLLSSHDQPRALFHFGYADETSTPEAITSAKQKLRLALFFQAMFPGAPTIYYGDEVGVTGGEDPLNRATYPWADEGGTPDLDLLKDVKKLLQVRNQNAVLRQGSLSAPLVLDEHVIVLARQLGKTWAFSATNNGQAAKTITVKIPTEAAKLAFLDPLTGEQTRAENGMLKIQIPAQFGTVLISQ